APHFKERGQSALSKFGERHSDPVISHTYDRRARFLTRLACAKVLVIDRHHLCFASTIRRLDLSVKDFIIMRGHFTMADNMRPRKSTLVVSNPCIAFPAQTVL